MKNWYFHLIPAAGVLALCVSAFAADPASVTRNEAASAAIAAPSEVTLHFRGAQRISENGRGGIDVVQGDGTLRHYQPVLYQTVDGKRKNVHYRYHVIDSNHVELKATDADASAPLEIATVRTNS